MKLILDCNIWISFLIGHQAPFVQKILTDRRFDVYVCDQLLDEIYDVANRDKIRKYVSKEDFQDFFHIIHAFCLKATIDIEAHSAIRDPKDLYLLSFAESIHADYIVSGDADLIVLENHKQTKIIRLTDFKRML